TASLSPSVNRRNPTARELFLSDKKLLEETGVEQLEDSFFHRLQLPNGTKKTTFRHRLDDVAIACNRLLKSVPAPIRLMDLAISSGVTTQDWMGILDRLNKSYRMDA